MRILVLALRRIAWMPPTLLGLIAIVFTISRIIPADPARVIAGENASPAQVEALRQKFGLDLPLMQQFMRYLRDIVNGDLGISLYSQRPVVEDLLGRLAATFELAIAAMCLAIMIGVPRCRIGPSPQSMAGSGHSPSNYGWIGHGRLLARHSLTIVLFHDTWHHSCSRAY